MGGNSEANSSLVLGTVQKTLSFDDDNMQLATYQCEDLQGERGDTARSKIDAYRCVDYRLIGAKCAARCAISGKSTEKSKEIQPKDLEILPNFKFANITGGEPFVRNDIEDIVEVMYTKTPRIVISTSGWHTKKIIKLAERFPNIGVRVSIEGLPIMNDDLRGREGGFDRGLRTLLALKEMGIKDIGFGQTVSNKNSHDLLPLNQLANSLGMEFATATFHNSYYFHKGDNSVDEKDEVKENFRLLIERLMKDKHPKSWFRAFFNLGLINYIDGNPRMLPCQAGTSNFFLEPNGDVHPCNGMEDKYWKESMGNIHEVDTFEELWFSEQAQHVRDLVRTCPKNCWMVAPLPQS